MLMRSRAHEPVPPGCRLSRLIAVFDGESICPLSTQRRWAPGYARSAPSRVFAARGRAEVAGSVEGRRRRLVRARRPRGHRAAAGRAGPLLRRAGARAAARRHPELRGGTPAEADPQPRGAPGPRRGQGAPLCAMSPRSRASAATTTAASCRSARTTCALSPSSSTFSPRCWSTSSSNGACWTPTPVVLSTSKVTSPMREKLTKKKSSRKSKPQAKQKRAGNSANADSPRLLHAIPAQPNPPRPPTHPLPQRRPRHTSSHTRAVLCPIQTPKPKEPHPGLTGCGSFVYWLCGGVLLSRRVAPAVPSALAGLASGFGMGPGVSPPPWPPQQYATSHQPATQTPRTGVVVGVGGCGWGLVNRLVDASSSPPAVRGEVFVGVCPHVLCVGVGKSSAY